MPQVKKSIRLLYTYNVSYDFLIKYVRYIGTLRVYRYVRRDIGKEDVQEWPTSSSYTYLSIQ